MITNKPYQLWPLSRGNLHTIRLLVSFLIVLGPHALAKSKPVIIILNADTKNIPTRIATTANRFIQLNITQSDIYRVLSPDMTINQFEEKGKKFPANCFSSTCLKTSGSLFPEANYILGSQLYKKKDNYHLAFRIMNLKNGKQSGFLKAKSDLSDTDLATFISSSIQRLLGISHKFEKTVDTTGMEEDNRIRFFLGTSALISTAAYIAVKAGQLKEIDNNNAVIDGVRPYPTSGHSYLRGFFAVPFIGAQYQGQGGAGAATVNDGTASMLNPAGLARLQNEWVTYSFAKMFGGIPSFFLSYCGQVYGNFYQALGVRHEGDDLAGETTFYTTLAFDLAPYLPYAAKLLTGINIKGYLISVGKGGEGIDRVTGNSLGTGIDLGFQFPLTRQIEAGIVFRDIYSYLKHHNTLTDTKQTEILPPQLLLAASYTVNLDMVFSIDGEKAILKDQNDIIKLGASKIFYSLFQLRMGAGQILNREGNRTISLGFGFKGEVEQHDIQVHYSYEFGTERTTSLNNTHQFSVEVGL